MKSTQVITVTNGQDVASKPTHNKTTPYIKFRWNIISNVKTV